MTYARVRTVHSGLAGGPYLSTHYFRTGVGLSVDTVTEGVRLFWDGCKDQISAGLTMQVQPVVQYLEETTDEVVAENTFNVAPVSGTNLNPAEFTAKQGIVNFRTATFFDGTRLSGRLFIPGVCGGSGEQSPTAPYRLAVEDAAQDLINYSANFQVKQVAVRRPKITDGVLRVGRIADITAASVPSKWGVLRSRRD